MADALERIKGVDLSARLDAVWSELERERLRADRAVAYGARLLLRIEALDQIVRDYATHHLDCAAALSVADNDDCSCGLTAQWRAADAWSQEEIGTVRTLM